MTSGGAETLTATQTLFYGGLMSFASAVSVVFLQTLFQVGRERYLERRATRERFSAHDLNKLKALEEAFSECSRVAQKGTIPEDAFDRIGEILLTTSPNPQVQEILFANFFFELKPRVVDVVDARHAVPRGEKVLAKVEPMKNHNYRFAVGVLDSAIVDLIRLFRVEAFGEETAKKHAKWFSRLRGRGRSG